MKNIYRTLVLSVFAAAVFGSCKEDGFETFKGGADIFFTYQRPSPTTSGWDFTYEIEGRRYTWDNLNNTRPMDSIICSFALIPETQRDSILLIPVSVMGAVSDRDRDIAVEFLDGTGDAGNFEVIKSCIFAGSAYGGIFLRLKRDNLPTEYDDYWIRMRLKENDEFTLRYDSIPYSDNTPEQTSVKDFKVHVLNSLTRPQYWMTGYFGTWSTAKAVLLLTEIGYPESELFGTPPDLGLMPAFGGLLKRYLQQKIAEGDTVKYINEQGEEVDMDWGASV